MAPHPQGLISILESPTIMITPTTEKATAPAFMKVNRRLRITVSMSMQKIGTRLNKIEAMEAPVRSTPTASNT